GDALYEQPRTVHRGRGRSCACGDAKGRGRGDARGRDVASVEDEEDIIRLYVEEDEDIMTPW
ncbi:hypothetical protein HAX54_002260, partial [Datura stramonium]|nr:hypothetical protein [Datura stramonium]